MEGELIVDYRRKRGEHAPIHIDVAVVERVESFKYIGAHNTKDLTWSTHTHSREMGMVAPLPSEDEKIWHGPSDSQKVLQLPHLEHLGCITA